LEGRHSLRVETVYPGDPDKQWNLQSLEKPGGFPQFRPEKGSTKNEGEGQGKKRRKRKAKKES